MKPDKDLQKDVMDQLDFDPSINSENIGVAVKDGVVTLSGTVPRLAEKYAAEKRTLKVEGVKSVVEDISVNLPNGSMHTDFDIAKAAADALNWNALVPPSVRATVEDGVITLQGEVDWGYEKESAEDLACHLKGVKGVNNGITLKSKKKLQPSEIQSRIESALTRSAREEVKNIKVDVRDDKVVLSGHVRSHEEAAEARWAAWATPGITTVESHLEVR